MTAEEMKAAKAALQQMADMVFELWKSEAFDPADADKLTEAARLLWEVVGEGEA